MATFLVYNILGFSSNGAGYLKHFTGPIPWSTPLMLPIEIISHLARPMSLTIRLYANMVAGEKVTLVFLALDVFSCAGRLHGPARVRFIDTSLHLHGADDDLHRRRGVARRALGIMPLAV